MLEFLNDYCDGVLINSNDTFSYATADYTLIDLMDIQKLLEIEKKYGYCGVLAFCAKVRSEEPLKPLVTKSYKLAKKELKDYTLFEDT